MLIYDETIRPLNSVWAYIAKQYESHEILTFVLDDLDIFISMFENYMRGCPDSLLDEFFLSNHPAFIIDNVEHKASLVMKFKRKENDGL